MNPTLHTERLTLRLPQLQDFDASADFMASERSKPVGGPIERHIAWSKFAAQAGMWALRGFGSWMLEEKSTGTLMGRVGLFYPDGWLEPELGWVAFEPGEGKGFIYEAAIAARNYAYDVLNMPALISTISADNTRSLKLANQLGAKYESDWQSPFGVLGVYRHPAPETRT